jgi:hypothetical protein
LLFETKRNVPEIEISVAIDASEPQWIFTECVLLQRKIASSVVERRVTYDISATGDDYFLTTGSAP